MKRILLTGGCGFLGHHLVEHLLKNTDAELVIVDRLAYASAGFDRLRDIKAFDDRRVLVLAADIADGFSEGVRREIGEPEFVIHAGAETHVDNSIVDPLPFVRANVLGTHHVLMFARGLKKLARLFYISTDEVYGPAPPTFVHALGHDGFREEDRFRPTNPYAATKAGAESLCMAYAHSFGIPITIVNSMNLFGERQHPEKFIPLVIRKVLAGEKLLIHANPERTRSGSRFYLHCRTLASALLFLMRAPHVTLRKVHISGEREVSNLDLAGQIARLVGKPLDYELVDFHSSRPGHDLRYALDDTLMRSLGWTQPVNFDESLERVVRWQTDPANARWLEWGRT